MAITKYEAYFSKIRDQIVSIKEKNDYKTESYAFAHWYLKNYFKLDEQQIAEAIIDGADDKGIDAIILDRDNSTLMIMQFKFPSKKSTINDEIDESSVLKILNGFKNLIDNGIPYTGKNQKFKEFKKSLESEFIDNFKIYFVSYNKGVIANKGTMEQFANDFQRDKGSNMEVIYHNRDQISNIFEQLSHTNKIKITLKYKQMQSAYNVTNKHIDSFVGFVNGKELVESVSNNIATIFDENIRLYEYNTSVNTQINRTATSTDQADMFYFYNNGIVFICNKTKNSPASNEIILEGASVVNGCQSLNVLYNAQQHNKLNDNVCVLVRIIEIGDYTERMYITEYLNSQNPIRDSYFISNHPLVRTLQKELFKHGYFLERQLNEFAYMKEREQLKGKEQYKVIQLEKAIQYYVGYWNNSYASQAKSAKNALFDKKKIYTILSDLTAEKVIEAYETYLRISEVLTMYRKIRRNSAKKEFVQYIGVTYDEFMQNDNFRFINTGDIILLNAVSNLKVRYKKLGIEIDDKELLIDAIFIICGVMAKKSDKNYSVLTKTASVFQEVQECISQLSSQTVRKHN